MKRKINQFIRYLKNNPREITFLISFIVVLGFVLFYFYSRFFVQVNLEKDIENKTSQISDISKQITDLTGDANYKRYATAKYIQSTVKVASWGNTISALVTIFDDIKGFSKDNLILTDFQIDLNEIKMKGQVKSLDVIYGFGDNLSGGIISNMENLDFIDFIDLPFFNKDEGDDFYKFDLTAKIKINDGKFDSSKTGTGSQSNFGK